MDALKKRLRPAEGPNGGGEVILVAGAGGGREVELKLPGRFALDAAVRGALKTAPGVRTWRRCRESARQSSKCVASRDDLNRAAAQSAADLVAMVFVRRTLAASGIDQIVVKVYENVVAGVYTSSGEAEHAGVDAGADLSARLAASAASSLRMSVGEASKSP